MGTVWRAYDELLGRRVAVKELHVDTDGGGVAGRGRTGGAGDPSVDSTLREARAVARVHHPHIVCVHDVVAEDGVPFIVMELVEGVTLAERIAEHGPVDAREAAAIGLALLSALRAAHAIGVLHRDLKPANVLLEESTGRVVLTDFGIAQLAGATTLTEDGMFVGSPEYTAPERVQGHRAGPASDLWSLGVLLCAVMTGRSPFHRDSLGGVLHAVVEAEIRPPAGTGPLLPVVRGLLERDPAHRLGAAEAERLLRVGWAADAAGPEGAAPGRAVEPDVPVHDRPVGRVGEQGDARAGARSHVRSPGEGGGGSGRPGGDARDQAGRGLPPVEAMREEPGVRDPARVGERAPGGAPDSVPYRQSMASPHPRMPPAPPSRPLSQVPPPPPFPPPSPPAPRVRRRPSPLTGLLAGLLLAALVAIGVLVLTTR
ncbi:serine/threonine protein kinase [Streptomyces sp. MUM 203J]|nr:serine/threonine-protein kinase [Streptomyces sp. MUM 203J]MCH0542233.1 serine/threonine protein kinase [Streptomyces sp. MUM 203J]